MYRSGSMLGGLGLQRLRFVLTILALYKFVCMYMYGASHWGSVWNAWIIQPSCDSALYRYTGLSSRVVSTSDCSVRIQVWITPPTVVFIVTAAAIYSLEHGHTVYRGRMRQNLSYNGELQCSKAPKVLENRHSKVIIVQEMPYLTYFQKAWKNHTNWKHTRNLISTTTTVYQNISWLKT